MSNPRLRIVLVDTDPGRRMSIEKDLGSLGYHRIVPVSSLPELIALLDNALDVFDLLVINAETVGDAGTGFNQLMDEYSCVRHSLIYQGSVLQMLPFTNIRFKRYGFLASGVPDRSNLKHVMSRVDAPLQPIRPSCEQRRCEGDCRG